MADSKQTNCTRCCIVTLTCLAACSTLLYLFLLLVPHWRLVQVDRELLQQQLQLHSSNTSSDAWKSLNNSLLLHSRSANLFRECLVNDWNKGGSSNSSGGALQALGFLPAAGANFSSSAELEVDIASGSNRTTVNELQSSGQRCWLLDLRWAQGLDGLSDDSRTLLRCMRALFILALMLLCCQFVTMVTALYACFSTSIGRMCGTTLLLIHCLLMSLLICIVVLQDFTRELQKAHLRRLVGELFPEGCQQAVRVSTGTCCLVLLCSMIAACGLQMLLQLFITRTSSKLNQQKQQQQQQQQQMQNECCHSNTRADNEEQDDDDNQPLIM